MVIIPATQRGMYAIQRQLQMKLGNPEISVVYTTLMLIKMSFERDTAHTRGYAKIIKTSGTLLTVKDWILCATLNPKLLRMWINVIWLVEVRIWTCSVNCYCVTTGKDKELITLVAYLRRRLQFCVESEDSNSYIFDKCGQILILLNSKFLKGDLIIGQGYPKHVSTHIVENLRDLNMEIKRLYNSFTDHFWYYLATSEEMGYRRILDRGHNNISNIQMCRIVLEQVGQLRTVCEPNRQPMGLQLPNQFKQNIANHFHLARTKESMGICDCNMIRVMEFLFKTYHYQHNASSMIVINFGLNEPREEVFRCLQLRCYKNYNMTKLTPSQKLQQLEFGMKQKIDQLVNSGRG